MSSKENTRVYGEIVNIDSTSIQSFWNAKAKKDGSIKAVLLGSDFAQDSGILRNERENKILCNLINNREQISVLDIGCGIGRWAYNLQSNYKTYHGIDFSSEFINSATKSFKENPNVIFLQMSATQIDKSMLLKYYDLVIVTGVAMYINDNEISRLFYCINDLTDINSSIYFQESVSILPHRLTLRNFDSKELNSKYNAIYRTREEYEDFFAECLPNYHVELNKTNLLLDKETGAREETNARYWFLERQH